jgi:hypothetical protein
MNPHPTKRGPGRAPSAQALIDAGLMWPQRQFTEDGQPVDKTADCFFHADAISRQAKAIAPDATYSWHMFPDGHGLYAVVTFTDAASEVTA